MKKIKFFLLTMVIIFLIITTGCSRKKNIYPYTPNEQNFTPTNVIPENTLTSTLTPTLTYTETIIQSPTVHPTLTGMKIDNFEDGEFNTNDRGGAWTEWASNGSNVHREIVTDSATENYAGKFSGDVIGSSWPSISISTDLNSAGTPEDLTSTQGMHLYMKGNYGSGTSVNYLIEIISTNITDYSYWRYTWTPSDTWTYVEIPWTSFSAPSWGQGSTMSLTEILQNVKSITFAIADITGENANSIGNEWYIDDIYIYGNISATDTYTPTYTETVTGTQPPTNTFTPTSTDTPTNNYTDTYTPTYTETVTGTQPPTNTFTPTSTDTPTNNYTNTYTPTYTYTPTQIATQSGDILDNFEDGEFDVNTRGGSWSEWAAESSTILREIVTDSGSGDYAGKFSGNVIGSSWPSISIITDLNSSGTSEDMSSRTGIKMYMKGGYGSGTTVGFLIELISTNITDYSYWRYTWTPSNTWTYVEIPWTSFSAPSWGQGSTTSLTAVLQNLKGIEWVISDMTGGSANNTGSEWYIDEVEIYPGEAVTDTPTFTETYTYTYTITPGGPTFTPTDTPTITPTIIYTPNDADDPHIQYIGRWNRSDLKNPKAGWGAVGIKTAFEGTSIGIKLTDSTNHFEYRIDGGSWQVLVPGGASQHTLATGLSDTIHTFELFRRTEGNYGLTTFSGFILDSGRQLTNPAARPDRRMLFIGDSITAGYGCECMLYGGCSSGNTLDNQNGNMSWAPRLARMFNADYQVIAQSGAGLYMNAANPPSTTDVLPIYYEQTYRNPSTPLWDDSYWENPSVPGKTADVIIIMLGTNDFTQYGHPGIYPTESQWKTAMNDFIDTLRTDHPNAHIFMVATFYNTDPFYYEDQWNDEIVVERGNPSWLHSLHPSGYDGTTPWISTNPADGDVMSDWTHPLCHDNVHGDYKIANRLYNIIKPIMGW